MMTVKEKIVATLLAVTSYETALLKAAWHVKDENARTVALAMTNFGRLECGSKKFLGFDGNFGHWAIDLEKSKNCSDYDVTRKIASDDFLLETLMFDLLEAAIRKLKFIGFARDHRLVGGAYQFSFKLEDGTIVDILQSPDNVELVNFEVDGKEEAWTGDFYEAVSVLIKD